MPITPKAVDAVRPAQANAGGAELFRAARRLSADEFARRFPYFFLVPEIGRARVQLDEFEEEESTGVTDLSQVRIRMEMREQLFAVRKIQSLYPDMITVGRTTNNDVPLRDESVSKFHAHFRIRQGVVYLLDADSKNGTFVDGQRLFPRHPTLVVMGALIGFGALRFRFFNALGAHEAVARR